MTMVTGSSAVVTVAKGQGMSTAVSFTAPALGSHHVIFTKTNLMTNLTVNVLAGILLFHIQNFQVTLSYKNYRSGV